MKRQVLVTGAAGRVAQLVIPHLQKEYDLVFTDQRQASTLLDPFVQAYLEDPQPWHGLCQGIDTVLHLGAISYEVVDWTSLVEANITGVQHVLHAAKAAGCRRVILMSSVQAMWGHAHRPILESDPPYPTNFYGATKAFAEALGRAYSHEGELSVICVRLGAVLAPKDARFRPGSKDIDLGITTPDLVHLLKRCLETEVQFAIVNGLSNNTNNRFGLEQGSRVLGYFPQDDAVRLANSWWGGLRWWLRRAQNGLRHRLAFVKH